MAELFMAIAGNMGSGKSTLTELLCRRFNWTPYLEPVRENPYLADFYRDMPRWAFHLQTCFLTHRFADHQAILEHSGSVIQDRTIYEDAEIFARNLYDTGVMEPRDWQTYWALASQMIERLPPPDLVVYLRRSVRRIAERIRLRGRDYEQEVPMPYLTQLNAAYDRWAREYRRGRLLVVDTDRLDFLENPNHLEAVASRIKGAIAQLDLFFDR